MSSPTLTPSWPPRPPCRKSLRNTQLGLTLIELMISLTIGLLITLAATAMLLSTRSAYTAGDDSTHMEDTGRYALEIVARAVRQAAYVNWSRDEAPATVLPGMSPSIEGLDARSLKADTVGLTSPQTQSVNGSDVLSVQFFGTADGTMLNCAGFPVPEEQRGASVFYVAKDGSGESQLYCKYPGDDSWGSGAIARGVETFQVLYGLDTDNDGMPNRLLNATAINTLDAAAAGAVTPQIRNAKTYWKKVVTISIALLVRGNVNTNATDDAGSVRYDLFDEEYSEQHGAGDPGVRLLKEDFPVSTRNRHRKVYSTTIQLRNVVDGVDG